ncbi:MAG: ATP-binding protein [Patescibacteria group bacterium]
MDTSLSGIANLDLLSVGIVVAGMAVLGFAVLFSNTQSASNRIFLVLAISTGIWGSLNYFSYQPNAPDVSFLLLRWAIFFGVLSAFFTFTFAYVFPSSRGAYSSLYRWGFIPLTAVTAFATLTPFVFKSISATAPDGHVTGVEAGPGILLFVATILILNVGAIVYFVRKLLKAKPEQKTSFQTILLGMFIMLALVVVFNLILPAFFENTRFIPLGALFLFPFIAATAYAVLKHKLFNIKVTGTAMLVFALSIITFGEVIFARESSLVLYRASIFVLVLVFGVSLIRGVVREVKQREEIEILAKLLKSANERLKELDKLKSQFLSIASHDLRAPLTTIRNFMSLLLDGTYGKLPVSAEEGMHRVFDTATEMSKSVDNYLNISRIEQGSMEYDFAPTDVAKLLSETAAAFKPEAEKKGLAFSFAPSSKSGAATVNADIAKLREVFSLLIDNAIKYTPKGSITISVERKEKLVRIAVEDTGVGIKPETMPKLFKMFSTDENSRRVNVNSSGVGLYVVKAHIEAHKGKVWAESEGEGKGSAFVVELPILA